MLRTHRGCDRMVVGFTTTCVISVYRLTLWVRIPLRRGVLDTTLCDKVCQWLATGQWFSLGTPVSSTNKTDVKHHNPNPFYQLLYLLLTAIPFLWVFINLSSKLKLSTTRIFLHPSLNDIYLKIIILITGMRKKAK